MTNINLDLSIMPKRRMSNNLFLDYDRTNIKANCNIISLHCEKFFYFVCVCSRLYKRTKTTPTRQTEYKIYANIEYRLKTVFLNEGTVRLKLLFTEEDLRVMENKRAAFFNF